MLRRRKSKIDKILGHKIIISIIVFIIVIFLAINQGFYKEVNKEVKKENLIQNTTFGKTEKKQKMKKEKEKKGEEDNTDCNKEKCITLTFDDGPGPYTEELLDILKKYNVKATFFVIGYKVYDNKEIIKREYDEGHLLGNHSRDHKNLNLISEENLKKQIKETKKAIKSVSGYDTIFLRPPYGAANENVISKAKKYNQSIIMWSIDSKDRQNPKSVKKNINNINKQLDSGGIILLHDIHKTTIDSVEKIIKNAKKEGYKFVRLDKLIDTKFEPGIKYFKRINKK